MAESFHHIIDKCGMEVEHWGWKVQIALPEMYEEIKGKTMDEAALVEWAKKHNILLPIFHGFFKDEVIQLRGTARPAVKRYNDEASFNKAWQKIVSEGLEELYEKRNKTLDITMKITEDAEVQDRVDARKLKPTPIPGQGQKAKEEQAALAAIWDSVEVMLEMGLAHEQIREGIQKKFGAVIAAQIANLLDSMED